MSPPSTYDVLIAADCRLERYRGVRISQEVRALAAAGYTVAILNVPDPGVWRGLPFSEPVARCIREGLADHLDPGEAARARLLVVHTPEPFLVAPTVPAVEADRVVLVLDAPTMQPYGERVADRIGDVTGTIERWTGRAPSIAVTRSAIRDALRDARDVTLLPDDWTEVIDPARWSARERPPTSTPMIGRHDLSGPADLPGSASDRRAAYPDGPDVEVAFLASSPAAAKLSRGGRRRVFPPGSIDRRGFLEMLDVAVFFPRDAETVRSFRPVLESLASGVPVIGAGWLADAFGDAVVTAEPSAVLAAVRRLTDDPAAYRAQAARGHAMLRERFSPEAHVARVQALIGEPSAPPRPPEDVPRARAATRILFVSSNGAGVGHLMRLMSIARHAGEDIEPIFFTLSQAVPAVRRMGFPVEYLASAGYTGMATPYWNSLLRRRLGEIIELYRPRAVVFDGTAPYRGLIGARLDHPGVPFVWSRRAMWRPGLGERALERSSAFDLVIEPGEFAAERDAGATVPLRDHAHLVDPVMIIEPDDLLPADEAKRELGLDPDRPAALVQLGAGNINDISSVLTIALAQLTEVEDLQVCTASSIIGTKGSPILERVKTVSVYPLARYFRAFDFAISASGYNTFHELIAAGIPTIFIPNLDTALDDQAARARYAADVGVGLCVEDVDAEAFGRALTTMLDRDQRREMAERCAKLAPGNGGRDAMAAIEDLIERWPRMPAARPRAPRGGARASVRRAARSVAERTSDAGEHMPGGVRVLGGRALRRTRLMLRRVLGEGAGRPAARLGTARRRIAAARALLKRRRRRQRTRGLPVPAGSPLAGVAAERLPLVVILLWGVDDDALTHLVDRIAVLQRSRLRVRPLFVTDRDRFGPFRTYGYQFEYLMPREEWQELGIPLSWNEYRWRRLSAIVQTFDPDHIVSAAGSDAAAQVETALLATVIRARATWEDPR